MLEIFLDSLFDTLKATPFLLVVYFVIEIIEDRYSEKINAILGESNKLGPFFGALFGSIPQCGFSVMASSLYARRIISLGVLMAVFLSTSDEAIPIILSRPEKAFLILPILGAKIIIALFFGYLISFIYRKKLKKETLEKGLFSEGKGCCGHHYGDHRKKWKEYIWHPIRHTFKISIFLFIITFALNMFFFKMGEGRIASLLLNQSVFQPIITALFGLIPNCVASVAIADLFVKGLIGFGSVIAGLSSSAGIGLLVLFKENKNLKENISILVLLFIISSFIGLVLQYIIG